MSQFATNMAAAGWPSLFDQFGQSVTYAGDPLIEDTALTAIVQKVDAGEDESDGDRIRGQMRVVKVFKDPNSAYGGVAAISDDAHFEIDGEAWAVTGQVGGNETVWEVQVARDLTVETAVDNYRRRR